MHDLLVVSDLHLGRGKNPASGRYYRLEAFFYDDDFEQFCVWAIAEAKRAKRGVKLILNGDTFDLLRIEPDEPDYDASQRERRFGAVLTPSRAADVMESILAGHRSFACGLARLLLAGHQVVFLPGNHDPEIQWKCVQDKVRDAVRTQARALSNEVSDDPSAADRADELLRFEPWFYYEPKRIWIEHGHQYDVENSFNFPLRGALADAPDSVHKAEKDVPMGTFFQRYLYNGFGNITFIVPSGRANLRYFRWLLLNKPGVLARVATGHFPFFLQVLRRIAKRPGGVAELRDGHDAALTALTKECPIGDKLRDIEALKRVRGSAAVVTRGVILQILKVMVFAVLLGLLVAGLWFAGFHSINQMSAGFGLKAALFLALNLMFLTSTAVGIGYILLRPPRGPPLWPMRRAATIIADTTDVPLVTFGHTHDETVWRLQPDSGRAAWYHNTGTWIAVFTHDELLPRERVQYTFLRVRDDEAELLHWSPGRGEAIPVILLEEVNRFGEPARPTEAQAS